MKRFIYLAAIAVVVSASSCSESEEVIRPPKARMDGSLGIHTGVIQTNTRAVIEGTNITYDAANYATDAKGLGIVTLNNDGTALYTPYNSGTQADEYEQGKPVWFMGSADGKSWKAISAKGTSFADATAKPYYLTETVGTLYAYYPYTASFEGTTKDNVAIAAPIAKTGTIDFTGVVSNADMVWDNGQSKWVSNSAGANRNSTKLVGDLAETDYLYFYSDPTTPARYINNGRANLDEPGGNMDAVNPGNEIDLSMQHAMSMLSFRVYNDGTMDGQGVLSKIVIKNADGKQLLKTGGTPKMKLADGVITGLNNETNLADETITRTITGYTIPREVKAGETQDETHFIASGSGSTQVTGSRVARKLSMIVYPIELAPGASDEDSRLIVTFTIDGTDYEVFLPLQETSAWEQGKNYLYTVCASRSALTVRAVSVTEWDTVPVNEEIKI
ncbi:fimbrillin family protein [Parabacteroides sp. PF5-9]|uniref:fimbrillin family protein n=1 Tax=Parabacteroides sp. PF5-9 TaxID=1742404 RepID=UPI002475D6F2|nr:fimbrillin family protein [Parabacteroides sp. PF5-9]MDH6358334.1 hypothetical protein [Parabacteroides sp. PF5-9]